MVSRLRVARVLAVSAIVSAGLAAEASPAQAASTVRYATVIGTVLGSCPITAPCNIDVAINDAPAGSTVIVEPGTYGEDEALDANDIDVHGAGGPRPPTIVSTAATGVALTNSSLAGVTIQNSVGVALSVDATSVADDVIAETTQTSGDTCEVLGTLTESVCEAGGFSFAALSVETNSTITPTLDADTIVAPGGDGVALEEEGTATLDIDITNSIIHGGMTDIAEIREAGGEKYDAFLVHTDSSTFRPDTGVSPADTLVTRNSTDIKAAPAFVDSNSLDFAEKAGSPTINKGEPEPSIKTDVRGEPRVSGSAPDMGAFEFQQKPTATGLTVTRRSAHSARIRLKVNPESLGTTVQVFAVHGHTTVSSRVASAGHGSSPKSEVLTINGLARPTRYTVYAVATNSAGRTTSAKKTISAAKK